MSTYMVTLSVLPPIDMIPPPPAMAPIESTPEMPEILSTTSSALRQFLKCQLFHPLSLKP